MGSEQPVGVALAQPHAIQDSIKRNVQDALGTLPEDAKGAIVAVGTARGVNLAIAYKLKGGWDVGAWVGKSGWDQPLDGGVMVQKVFR